LGSEKGARYDSKIVLDDTEIVPFDFKIVRYDVEIVHSDPENTGSDSASFRLIWPSERRRLSAPGF
jgi:hypothetical protein